MRVPPQCILMSADAVGGVWQYSLALADGLARHGWETRLAVIGPSPSDEQCRAAEAVEGLTLIDTGLPLDWLSGPAGTDAAAVELAAIARSEGAALAHLNSPALTAGRPFDVPTVAVAHGCLATWWDAARPDKPIDRDMVWHVERMGRGLRDADLVLAPSASLADTLRRVYALPLAPGVVHNGRDLPLPCTKEPPADFAFTAGRLWDQVKNILVLDRAAALLPFPLEAAGPVQGPNGERISPEHLRLPGTLSEAAVQRRLAERPVFVSAASFEPFGFAVLEAAAAGCALVLSDIATFRELWDGAAEFVAPDDAEGFARAIERLIADPAHRARLAHEAAARAGRYSAGAMAAAMDARYRRLLTQRLAA